MGMRILGAVALLVLVAGIALRMQYGRPQVFDTSQPTFSSPPPPSAPRPSVDAGEKAPAFELKDLAGKKTTLKTILAGQPVLIWFFAPS